MRPKWLRLIDAHQRKGGFGLTPPFLLGALRTPPGAVLDEPRTRAEFRELLESMRNETPGGTIVRISECSRLRQPIAAVVHGMAGGLGESVVHADGSPSNLFAWPDYFVNESRNVESLTAALWKIMGPVMCEGRFSYREGAYQPFDVPDMQFIERALLHDDDA